MKHHFFDVGANIGQTFTDFLTKTDRFDGWDVWCFEPSPRHLPELMATAAAQESRFWVHVCPFGIRGESGTLAFHQKDDPQGDSFEPYLASDHETQNLRTGYELRVFSAGIVDAIDALTDPGDSIILKLDCEGSEFSILEKLLKFPSALARLAEIHVEFHHIKEGGSEDESNKLLRAYAARGIELKRWMF